MAIMKDDITKDAKYYVSCIVYDPSKYNSIDFESGDNILNGKPFKFVPSHKLVISRDNYVIIKMKNSKKIQYQFVVRHLRVERVRNPDIARVDSCRFLFAPCHRLLLQFSTPIYATDFESVILTRLKMSPCGLDGYKFQLNVSNGESVLNSIDVNIDCDSNSTSESVLRQVNLPSNTSYEDYVLLLIVDGHAYLTSHESRLAPLIEHACYCKDAICSRDYRDLACLGQACIKSKLASVSDNIPIFQRPTMEPVNALPLQSATYTAPDDQDWFILRMKNECLPVWLLRMMASLYFEGVNEEWLFRKCKAVKKDEPNDYAAKMKKYFNFSLSNLCIKQKAYLFKQYIQKMHESVFSYYSLTSLVSLMFRMKKKNPSLASPNPIGAYRVKMDQEDIEDLKRILRVMSSASRKLVGHILFLLEHHHQNIETTKLDMQSIGILFGHLFFAPQIIKNWCNDRRVRFVYCNTIISPPYTWDQLKDATFFVNEKNRLTEEIMVQRDCILTEELRAEIKQNFNDHKDGESKSQVFSCDNLSSTNQASNSQTRSELLDLQDELITNDTANNDSQADMIDVLSCHEDDSFTTSSKLSSQDIYVDLNQNIDKILSDHDPINKENLCPDNFQFPDEIQKHKETSNQIKEDVESSNKIQDDEEESASQSPENQSEPPNQMPIDISLIYQIKDSPVKESSIPICSIQIDETPRVTRSISTSKRLKYSPDKRQKTRNKKSRFDSPNESHSSRIRDNEPSITTPNQASLQAPKYSPSPNERTFLFDSTSTDNLAKTKKETNRVKKIASFINKNNTISSKALRQSGFSK